VPDRVPSRQRSCAHDDDGHNLRTGVNHWPMVREPTLGAALPEFPSGVAPCLTADGTKRYARPRWVTATCNPAPTEFTTGGALFEEFSLGYPSEGSLGRAGSTRRARCSAAAVSEKLCRPRAGVARRRVVKDVARVDDAAERGGQVAKGRCGEEEKRSAREFGTVRHMAPTRSPSWGGTGGVIARWSANRYGGRCGRQPDALRRAGYGAPWVERAADVHSFGIDAETPRPAPEGVARSDHGARRAAPVAALSASDPSVHWGRMCSSAKESGLQDVRVRWPGDGSAFEDRVDHSSRRAGWCSRAEMLVAVATGPAWTNGFSGPLVARVGRVITRIRCPSEPSR